jgi:hypothetical protein
MTTRLLFAVLLGAAVGGAVVSVGPLHSAPVTVGETKWEYKVVAFAGDRRDSADKVTEQFNTLAGHGWEYVGPVTPRQESTGGGALVAFRKPKS